MTKAEIEKQLSFEARCDMRTARKALRSGYRSIYRADTRNRVAFVLKHNPDLARQYLDAQQYEGIVVDKWSDGHGDIDDTRIGRCCSCRQYVYRVRRSGGGNRDRSEMHMIVNTDHRPHSRTCAGVVREKGALGMRALSARSEEATGT